SSFSNSFFGTGAGRDNVTGSLNAFFGAATGIFNTGENNAFFGGQAGISNTTGSGNTIVGTNANVGANNLTNATAIGNLAAVTQSNSLVLGSINRTNNATADTNVGIGTTAPLGRLDVRGDILLGLSAAPLVVPGTANSLFVANDGGDIQNSLRIDGAGNNLFLVARSDAGATAGPGIIFRT